MLKIPYVIDNETSRMADVLNAIPEATRWAAKAGTILAP